MTTGLGARQVVPEILDELAPGDPAARASRGDLRRINALMRAAGIAADLVRRHVPGRLGHVVDLGCGDGRESLRVARRLGRAAKGARWTLLDMRPDVGKATRAAFRDLGWAVEIAERDAFDWMASEREASDLVLANLVLHHFDDAALPGLMAHVARTTRHLVATEPARSRFAIVAAGSVGIIGANAVTRHDAPASVRAGFAGRELSALWPGAVAFEGRRGLFVHGFAARGIAS